MSLRSWARSFFTPVARRARRSSATKYRPRGESLESRLALAGNVVAYTAGANLFINGDALANEIRIEGNGTGVDVLGVNATSVNGRPGGEFNALNVQNIFLEMGNGDDRATFVLTDLRGLLRFNGGNGHDQLWFGEGNSGQNSFGTLAVNMGAGDDLIAVDQAETRFRVPGSVTIANGEGLNSTFLGAADLVSLGTTSISGGSGFDNVQIGSTTASVITGLLNVNGGNGGNQFYLVGNTTVVNGGITLLGGSGDDTNYTGFGGTLKVNGSIIASLGDGGNLLSLENNEVVVTGVVSQIGGAGRDQFQIGTTVFDALAVTLSLGTGANVVALDSGTSTIRTSLTVTSLGNEGALIWAAGLDVRGATVVTTGNGADFIQIDNSRFRGAVVMSTTGGNDRVLIERGTYDDGIGTRFDTTVSIDLGAGNDELAAGFDANDFVTFNRLIANGGAGTDTFTNSPFNVYTFPRTVLAFP